MGDLGEAGTRLLAASPPAPAARFLAALEGTLMTRSYKMLVLLALLHRDAIPGGVPVADLVAGFAAIARRSGRLRRDVGSALDDPAALRRLVVRYPVAVWVGGKGTGGDGFFAVDGERFASTFAVAAEDREAFRELARELAEWRLAEYLDRPGSSSGERFVCNVSHAGGGRPILFLPDRSKHPWLPRGWTRVSADGVEYQANFAKVALNVMRRTDSTENELADLLRRWFGPRAGDSGTAFRVIFQHSEHGWDMEPQG
jgi:hypothetical protein